MVNAMPASEYLRFCKSAKMLFAEMRLADIETACFPNYKDESTRDKVMRKLHHQSTQFLFQPIKDFAEVAANFAKALKNV